MKRLPRVRYGESLFHLVVMLASFALCGYALVRLLAGSGGRVAAWVAGAAAVHDLLLVPLYGGADWLLRRAVRAGRPRSPLRAAAVQHVRVPAFVSLLLLLVHWPLISGASGPRYRTATLLDPGVFPGHWLLITAVLFAGSGALFALRVRRAARGARRTKSLRTHGGSVADRPSAAPET